MSIGRNLDSMGENWAANRCCTHHLLGDGHRKDFGRLTPGATLRTKLCNESEKRISGHLSLRWKFLVTAQDSSEIFRSIPEFHSSRFVSYLDKGSPPKGERKRERKRNGKLSWYVYFKCVNLLTESPVTTLTEGFLLPNLYNEQWSEHRSIESRLRIRYGLRHPIELPMRIRILLFFLAGSSWRYTSLATVLQVGYTAQLVVLGNEEVGVLSYYARHRSRM